MWLTDLLRKLTQGPRVGETFRDYIGCYLYGSQAAGSHQPPAYIGAPASAAQLEADIRHYLQDFLSTQQDHSTPAARTIAALLAELPARLQAHLHSDMTQPFVALDGTELFIRTGVRQRRKENGKFVE